MATWRQSITDPSPRKPPVGPYAGLKPARRSRVNNVIKAQDHVANLGVRVIGAQSLRGAVEWLAVDGNPAGSPNHPEAGSTREAMRIVCRVTPGYLLRLSVLCVPSGETVTAAEAAGGADGWLEVDVTWYYQEGNVATTHTVSLPQSPLEFGDAPSDAWASIQLVKHDFLAGAAPFRPRRCSRDEPESGPRGADEQRRLALGVA